MKRTKNSEFSIIGTGVLPGAVATKSKYAVKHFKNSLQSGGSDPVIEINSSSDESVIQISSDEFDDHEDQPVESVATFSGSAMFGNNIRPVMKNTNSSTSVSDRSKYDDTKDTTSDLAATSKTKASKSSTSLLLDLDCPGLKISSSRKKINVPSSSQPFTFKTKKDQLKEEAARKKEMKRLEIKEKKEAVEREKLIKKSTNEVIRNSKPGEVHKFMTIILDDDLAEKFQLIQVIDEAGINHESTVAPIIDKSFSFKRELSYQAMGDDLQMQKVSKWETEDQLLVMLDPEDIVPKIYVHINGTSTDPELDEIDFITFVKSLQATSSATKITLLLYGMDGYFKKMKKNTQQEFRDRVLHGDQQKKNRKKKVQLPAISNLEFQSALIELQLETKVNYRHVNTVKEVGRMLVQYTKAIAEAPFKRARKEQGFDWFASADSAGSVKVDSKDGKGLKLLWVEQIQLFNNVGIDTAQAIVNLYPSPRDLIDRYSKCRNLEEGQTLLRDIQVRMGIGPLAKNRKVGPELSKKIYRFFTSTNPERCLGSTQEF